MSNGRQSKMCFVALLTAGSKCGLGRSRLSLVVNAVSAMKPASRERTKRTNRTGMPRKADPVGVASTVAFEAGITPEWLEFVSELVQAGGVEFVPTEFPC